MRGYRTRRRERKIQQLRDDIADLEHHVLTWGFSMVPSEMRAAEQLRIRWQVELTRLEGVRA